MIRVFLSGIVNLSKHTVIIVLMLAGLAALLLALTSALYSPISFLIAGIASLVTIPLAMVRSWRVDQEISFRPITSTQITMLVCCCVFRPLPLVLAVRPSMAIWHGVLLLSW